MADYTRHLTPEQYGVSTGLRYHINSLSLAGGAANEQ
jgi:hypothetical protein